MGSQERNMVVLWQIVKHICLHFRKGYLAQIRDGEIPSIHNRRPSLSWAAVEIQTSDPCGGLHDHSVDCKVHELGEALPPGLEVISAEFCHCEPGQRFRSEDGMGACEPIRSGEIVVFDKAYVDFAHLQLLHQIRLRRHLNGKTKI